MMLNNFWKSVGSMTITGENGQPVTIKVDGFTVEPVRPRKYVESREVGKRLLTATPQEFCNSKTQKAAGLRPQGGLRGF